MRFWTTSRARLQRSLFRRVDFPQSFIYLRSISIINAHEHTVVSLFGLVGIVHLFWQSSLIRSVQSIDVSYGKSTSLSGCSDSWKQMGYDFSKAKVGGGPACH